MAVRRGILFELQTSLASDADAAFSALEKRIDALQGKMRFSVGGGGYGNGNGNGNGNGYQNGNGYSYGNGNGNGNGTAPARRGGANRITGFAGGGGYGASGAGPLEDSKQVDRAIADIQRLQRAADEAQRKDDERARKVAERTAILQGRQRGKLEKSVVDKEEKYQADRQRTREREEAQEAAAGQRHAKEREREQARAARESEIAAGRQREGQHRLGESIGQTTDALTRMGEGFAYLGLIGQRDLGTLSDSLLRIKGTAESVRGIAGLLRGGSGVGSLLGGAGRAGAGALAGAGGLAVGGGAAALALLANMGTGGRFTNAGGRFLASSGIGISQRMHSLGNVAETFGMGEAERGQVAYRRATQMEDVNHPSGFGLGTLLSAPGAALTGNYNYRSGLGGDIDAAAAAARNTQRLQGLNANRQRQREYRHQVETGSLGVDLQAASMRRETTNQRDAALLMQTRDFATGRARQYFMRGGHTGIGAMPNSMFRQGGAFSNARGIEDRSQRMAFLGERSGQFVENHVEGERLAKQRASLEAEMRQVNAAKVEHASEGNAEANKAADQRRNELQREMNSLVEQEDALRRKTRQEEIEGATKLLQLQVQRAGTAQDTFQSRTRGLNSEKARLGMMDPSQFRAIAAAKKKAQEGGELSRHDIELLQNSDQEGRFLADTEARKRFEQMNGEGPGRLLNTEEMMQQSAATNATRQAEKRDNMAGELREAAGQVIISRDFNITVDVRQDEELTQKFLNEVLPAFQEIAQTNESQISDLKKLLSESLRRMNNQGRQVAAE